MTDPRCETRYDPVWGPPVRHDPGFPNGFPVDKALDEWDQFFGPPVKKGQGGKRWASGKDPRVALPRAAPPPQQQQQQQQHLTGPPPTAPQEPQQEVAAASLTPAQQALQEVLRQVMAQHQREMGVLVQQQGQQLQQLPAAQQEAARAQQQQAQQQLMAVQRQQHGEIVELQRVPGAELERMVEWQTGVRGERARLQAAVAAKEQEAGALEGEARGRVEADLGELRQRLAAVAAARVPALSPGAQRALDHLCGFIEWHRQQQQPVQPTQPADERPAVPHQAPAQGGAAPADDDNDRDDKQMLPNQVPTPTSAAANPPAQPQNESESATPIVTPRFAEERSMSTEPPM